MADMPIAGDWSARRTWRRAVLNCGVVLALGLGGSVVAMSAGRPVATAAPLRVAESALLRGCPGAARATRRDGTWSADIVVVVAVFDEFHRAIPRWACPDMTDRYVVAPFYQRLDPAAARYVPNNANEAGVYLRFVRDHYQSLPKLTVFLQADAVEEIPDLRRRINALSLGAMRARGIGYLPMNDLYVRDRTLAIWRARGYGGDVQDCWERVARWFGHPEPFRGMAEPTVSMYCCAYHAVTAENVRRTPLATWALVYHQLVERGTCHPHHHGPDRDRSYHEGANAFEHLAPLIWGDAHARARYEGPNWSEQLG